MDERERVRRIEVKSLLLFSTEAILKTFSSPQWTFVLFNGDDDEKGATE
jgi:hypothetical protein